MKPVTLHTARLVLDQPTVDDVDDIARYCQDPLFEKVLTTPWPYTREDALAFATEFLPNGWRLDTEYGWALRLDGLLVGVASWRARGDVGFWMGEPHRGRGYMTEAVGAILDWVFSTGVGEVSWECLAGNAGSASVARKAGFTYTGARDSLVVHRGGVVAPAWHGVIAATDSRAPKPGWPV
jgi:RimJ/RimL family protein N-acetyltransferase